MCLYPVSIRHFYFFSISFFLFFVLVFVFGPGVPYIASRRDEIEVKDRFHSPEFQIASIV